jgi:hypothetical protein
MKSLGPVNRQVDKGVVQSAPPASNSALLRKQPTEVFTAV